MNQMKKKKLPIGIENFEDIRKEDFYYIDKTMIPLIIYGACFLPRAI